MALIKCKNCGSEISDLATTCIHCGCSLKESTTERKCSECGNTLSEFDTLCPKCGCPINPKAEVKKEAIIKEAEKIIQETHKTINKGHKIQKLIIFIAIAIFAIIGIYFLYTKVLKGNIPGAGNNNDVIIGEWLNSSDDYFEFFEDNTFEYTCKGGTCPTDFVPYEYSSNADSACVTKGKYEIKNQKRIYFYPDAASSTCPIGSEQFIWAFDDEYTQICANNAGWCWGGWQQTSTTPYHLNNDGSRIK